METCKTKFSNFFLFLIILIFFQTQAFASNFEKIEKSKVSIIDLVIFKIETFMIKNKQRMFVQDPFKILYQEIGINVKYVAKDKIHISVLGIMDKIRYKKTKKYKPNIKDCNVIRNKIFYNKYGYSPIRRTKTLELDENYMKEILKEYVFNLNSLDENQIDFLIDNTYIEILISHPLPKYNISCIGRLTAFELE
tara:strand:- start:34 stop:615 length:582 start_codon:yes stop_codon:yes gene_type:complete